VALGFIAILIPIVLFIFSLEKNDLFEWDKVVILDKVIETKFLAVSLMAIFFPVFIWELSSNLLKLILFIFFLGGTGYLMKILTNTYRWIKTVETGYEHHTSNFRSVLRQRYLNENSNLSEKEKIWALTWRKEIS